jgi:hypothetical protein
VRRNQRAAAPIFVAVEEDQAIKSGVAYRLFMDWQAIQSAPFDRDLELAVIDAYGPHALVFPCRHALHGWMKTDTKQLVDVHPTHWREWQDSNSVLFSLAPPFQRSRKV